MNLLALDLATVTGWALRERGQIESGVQTFDVKRGESPGMRYVRLGRWLEEIGARAEMVVYEQVVPAPAKFGGATAREIAFGMAAHVQRYCAARGIEHATVYPSSLKKWLTGKGNSDKAACIAAVRRRWGYAILDDNHADALALLHYAEAEMLPAGAMTTPGPA